MASKSGYVRLTYISVRTFAYGPLRTYVRLFAYVRIRPSWVQYEFLDSDDSDDLDDLDDLDTVRESSKNNRRPIFFSADK